MASSYGYIALVLFCSIGLCACKTGKRDLNTQPSRPTDAMQVEPDLDEPGKEDVRCGAYGPPSRPLRPLPTEVTIKSKLIVGKIVVKGALPEEHVADVARDNASTILACFEEEPHPNDRIKLQWVISPQGTVSPVKVEWSTLSDEAVEDCIRRQVRRWTFDEVPEGGVAIVTMILQFD